MAIVLKVEKYCDNCPDFEASVKKEELVYYDGMMRPTPICKTLITCEHRERCRCQMEYLAEQKRKEESDG